jgi:hypothetical protein
MKTFHGGQRVVLLPFEDQPKQNGYIIGDEDEIFEEGDMVTVQVDKEQLEHSDDGLRELEIDEYIESE